MTKKTKTVLVVSAALMSAGLLLTASGTMTGGHPGFFITEGQIFSASSETSDYTYEKAELKPFSEIEFDIESESRIEILPSENDSCYLEYTLSGNYPAPTLSNESDILKLEQKTNNYVISLFDFEIFNTDRDSSQVYIRLYIPEKTKLERIEIKNDNGDFSADSISCEDFSVHLYYGNISLSKCNFDRTEICTDSGDIESSDCSMGNLILKNDYGDTALEHTDLKTADFTIESGNLSLETFSPDSVTGINEYGDTVITVDGDLSQISFDLYTEYGTIRVPSQASGVLTSDTMEMSFRSKPENKKKIQFSAESGDITINP